MNLYQENILDHYQHPRNKRVMKKADIRRREPNPVCGDDIEIFIKLRNGKVAEAQFEGNGCAISMAAASMLTEELIGKTPKVILKMNQKSMVQLLGVDPGTARISCATLALKATQNGLIASLNKTNKRHSKKGK
ncbi:SUF system NifU family Fe-S cluster assembly protein [Candidatus Micrarchaeota archaeon]|nr:SUF system NifU family Fe-S cluster assembly protein [Candidatus Micrarchaeota archaeon]